MAKRKMKIPIAKQIQGCRKALKNPRTPRAFIPGLKKRLKQLLAAIVFVLALPALSRAQFIGYTTPQTVQQTLATNASCTGVNQTFIVANLGQNQHSTNLSVSASTTSAAVFIQGQDAVGNVFPISDTAFSVHTFASTPAVTASGYYPIINVVVKCTGGTFTLNYAGTSSQSNVSSGAYLNGSVDKALFQFASQGSTVISPQFVSPYDSSYGLLTFQYQTAAVAGSTLTVSCVANGIDGGFASYLYALASVTTVQIFPVPNTICPLITVTYNSGGASANTYSMDYLFAQPGSQQSSPTATNLVGSGFNLLPVLVEKGARWQVLSAPAAGSQATASKAAGGASVRHVADCVSFSAGAIAAPVATVLQVNLRDGASGAGTIIWTQTIDVSTAIGSDGAFSFCGLNLIGSVNTAMTLEYSASLANLNQSVTLTGYDVQ